jgi:hypothetical protein
VSRYSSSSGPATNDLCSKSKEVIEDSDEDMGE